MSDVSVAVEGEQVEKSHGPSAKELVKIAVILAVITALEVSWSYFPFWDGADGVTRYVEVIGLVIMMMAKFVIVAAWFMHLKFDHKVITGVFYFGFIVAVTVYVGALTTFEIWSDTKGFIP